MKILLDKVEKEEKVKDPKKKGKNSDEKEFSTVYREL